MTWRSIDSAPKDGTLVLLYREMSPWRVVGYGKWVNDFGIEGWLSYGFNDPPGNLGLAAPSHWMPLPTFPEKERKRR